MCLTLIFKTVLGKSLSCGFRQATRFFQVQSRRGPEWHDINKLENNLALNENDFFQDRLQDNEHECQQYLYSYS